MLYSGLSTQEYKNKLVRYGPNKLPELKKDTILKVFLRQFKSPLIDILLVAAILSFIVQSFWDSIFILIILLINALVGTTQEWKASQAAENLKKLIVIKSRVIRDNKEQEILTKDIVPDDIVLLDSGDFIPADIKLLQIYDLIVDESLLTGESVAIKKDLKNNMVYAGCYVIKGRAVGQVITTGIHTQLGLIAQKVLLQPDTKTPLLIELERFSKKLGFLIIILSLFVVFLGVFKGMELKELFFLTIALIVAAIPEGLPVATTVALSVGAHFMSLKKVIIRKLSAVEGLGSCNCVASDKTGTLTLNKQTITKVFLANNQEYDISGLGYHGLGQVSLNKQEQEVNKDLNELAFLGSLCNEAHLELVDNEWKHHGDDVDLAFLALAYKVGLNYLELRREYQVKNIIHFESEYRYAAAILQNNGQDILAIKGALEVLIDNLKFVLKDGQVIPIEQIDKEIIIKKEHELSGNGYKVLTVVKAKEFDITLKNKPLDFLKNTELIFVGLVGLIDPLRPEAKSSILKAKELGINVIMVTGDHPETAYYIAKELNLVKNFESVMTGEQLDLLIKNYSENYKERLKDINVFARVNPLQKLEIVKLRQELGDYVAVTGDGVNDCPALKQANIGVSMGSGTDIAKNTASIIISDDNFLSLVQGIKVGRHVFANIRKIISLLVSTGFAEILLVLGCFMLNLPVALFAIQYLWLNIMTNGLQEISLAFEPEENNKIYSKKNNRKKSFIDFEIIKFIIFSGMSILLGVLGLWVFLLKMGFTVNYSRNLVFLFFIILKNYHVFNCRSETGSIFKINFWSNKLLLLSIFGVQLIHLFAMNFYITQRLLHIQPVNFLIYIALYVAGFYLIILLEIYKFLNNKFNNKGGDNA